jgi:hypothetical protein
MRFLQQYLLLASGLQLNKFMFIKCANIYESNILIYSITGYKVALILFNIILKISFNHTLLMQNN